MTSIEGLLHVELESHRASMAKIDALIAAEEREGAREQLSTVCEIKTLE